MTKVLTLCILHDDANILLGMKKRGFGEGKWNGFGGKVEEGETVEEAVLREMKEESGVSVHDIKKRGVLTFRFLESGEVLEVHIFSARDFSGEPAESEEMFPQWYALEDIPYDSMWPDDKYWLPVLLKGKNFTGEFSFDESNAIVAHTLEHIENFPISLT
jgi:8-oxo-dGTP diphosphatase / 2-hydroxy-dATP diphosphatase